MSDILGAIRRLLCPEEEAPAYTPTFRLSREEIQMLEIVVILGVRAAINPEIALEWIEAKRLGNQYPYRQPDPNLVCSIGIRDLFSYRGDGERGPGDGV